MSNSEPRFYPVDAPNAYPEPVGTLDKLEHHDGAVWVHLNGRRSKLVGLQSLAFLIGNLQEIHAEVFSRPVEQHQGEPVELPERKGAHLRYDTLMPTFSKGWNACLDEIAKLGPLYTHPAPPDPGEVERLREENKHLRDGWYKDESDNNRFWPEEIEELRAELATEKARADAAAGDANEAERKLAERGAPHPIRVLGKEAYSTLVGMVEYCLNQRVCMGMGEGFKSFDPEEEHDFVKELRTFVALSTSAEPNKREAQALQAEKALGIERLPAEPSAPVEIDAPTDLATWKRRAIEAESKLRTYDPQVVELGERAMQALLADPKPSEVVLTKCKLCDQLQADLTARDQRIDQLEQQRPGPDGFALVPRSMLLAKEVIGVINFHCGDTDQEEGGQFGQYTDGRLWVGYVLDDDGNKVHGLHIATDEYQEEGSTTLVEFPEPGAKPEPEQCGACANGCQLDKDSPNAEVMDISDLGADAVCGICYDTGYMIIDDTGPEYVTTPCMECDKGQQLAAKP